MGNSENWDVFLHGSYLLVYDLGLDGLVGWDIVRNLREKGKGKLLKI